MAIQRRWGRFVWHRKHGGPRRTRLGDGDPGQATITVNHFECAHPYLFLSPAVHSPFLWCFIPSHSATALFLHSALWSSPHCLSCWRCAPSLRESSLETAPLPSTWAAQQGHQFPPREPSNKVASPLSASHPTSPLIPSTRASGRGSPSLRASRPVAFPSLLHEPALRPRDGAFDFLIYLYLSSFSLFR